MCPNIMSGFQPIPSPGSVVLDGMRPGAMVFVSTILEPAGTVDFRRRTLKGEMRTLGMEGRSLDGPNHTYEQRAAGGWGGWIWGWVGRWAAYDGKVCVSG